ncbi:hypothetical protein BROUX41_002950 [Berkeleyomyces rouxiae]|uniref:uncharacterized protein n=1 Tax=Berkeleyomyces rouxiae TaxID=2035830 RepID=UPI003B7A0D76
MSGLGHAPPHMGMPPFVPYMHTEFAGDRYHSPPGTATSSPRATPYPAYYPAPPPRGMSTQSPPRPATRAQFRTTSATATPVYNVEYGSPRPPTASPRYNSEGHYATANVSNGLYSRNFPSFAASPLSPAHSRRHSFIPTRDSTPSGESDEEIFTRDGALIYAASSGRQRRSEYHASGNSGLGPSRRRNSFGEDVVRGHATDREFSQAGPYHSMHDVYEKSYSRHHDDIPSRPTTAPRRPSMTTPQRPATTAPRSSHKKSNNPTSPAATKSRVATEADAVKHGIPTGYSFKNWDPNQTPILLLGSVFDANSLGKWIYDWTVFHHTASSREAELAGQLWLYLIQVYGLIRTGDQTINSVRDRDARKFVESCLESGDRLTLRLRKLLQACEEPMLRAADPKKSLGNNSGTQFVETLFGEGKQLGATKKLLTSMHHFIERWDANCREIIQNPTR